MMEALRNTDPEIYDAVVAEAERRLKAILRSGSKSARESEVESARLSPDRMTWASGSESWRWAVSRAMARRRRASTSAGPAARGATAYVTLEPCAHRPRARIVEVVGAMDRMAAAIPAGNQHLDGAANHLVAGEPEQPLRLRVHQRDPPVRPRNDDGVGSRLEQPVELRVGSVDEPVPGHVRSLRPYSRAQARQKQETRTDQNWPSSCITFSGVVPVAGAPHGGGA